MSEREMLIETIGNHFAALVGRQTQPDMSGNPRTKLLPHERRSLDDACEACADAILARPEPSEAMVEAVAQSLGDVLSSRERYYFTDPTRNRDGSLSMSFDGEVNLTELARAAIAAYDGEV